MDEIASVSSSFSSNVSRSSTLRSQREAALRRRHQKNDQIQMMPIETNSRRPSTSSSHRMSSLTTNAMADVMAWEEIKTKERIEARIKEEEARRVEEEARRRAERAEQMARAAEEKEEEKLELERRLAGEQRAREEAARQLEEESRRLAEAKAEVERVERERLEAEAAKTRAELKRLEMELKRERDRAKFEADQLAEQRRLEEQRSQSIGGSSASGTGYQQHQQPPSHINGDQQHSNDEEAYGHFANGTPGGSNSGYQRYLSSFHQPVAANVVANGGVREDATVVSELTEMNSPHETTNAEMKDLKLKRSISSRSLSFNKGDDGDRIVDTAKDFEHCQLSSSNKTFNLKQITSIDNVNLDDPNEMRSFLMKPCPKQVGMIQCCIRRNKGIKNALFPEYRIYLKSSNKTETFLMTSKKRVGNKTSNYLISMSRNEHDKNSDCILGKLRSNFLGTEYMIYDHGKNPEYDDSYYDERNDSQDIRCEMGAILYATSTSLGAKGPRKMKVVIGKVDDEGGNALKVWQPTNKSDGMITCFKQETEDIDKLVPLTNKPPEWNDEVGAYVLNFNGKVTMASVKNFQLCDNDAQQIMQFGRIGKEDFHLDVKWPMSLFQAFAVALSSFDSKLGCD